MRGGRKRESAIRSADAAAPRGPTLRGLFAPFSVPLPDVLAEASSVAAESVPEPFQRLLVHRHHMTVTVEAHWREAVAVRVLESVRCGETYARMILLDLERTRQVVQFGIVRIHLSDCAAEVRAAILAERTPLGRILINHQVLRSIEPTAYLGVVPGPKLLTWFGLTEPQPTYGRLGIIHCEGRPAIELLEIVRPE